MPELGPATSPATGSALNAAAVVLAAGASQRLGQPKQLILWEGESLLRRSARFALEAGCFPVVAVLGFEAESIGAALAGLPIEAVVNPKWSSGMGSSLACGVAAARRARPEMDALLLLVCDQPRLTANHLRHLLARHAAGQAAITASAYAGRSGAPAVFASSLLSKLEQIEGDRGARDLILRHGAQTVDWPDGACDIDLPEDLGLLAENRA
jgi:molybdenum cofactor cytidylyltransferase